MIGLLTIQRLVVIDVALAVTTVVCADVPGYPVDIRQIQYRSSGDDTMQPALFWAPESRDPVPLLVALHTWSGSYQSKEPQYARWCQQAGWAFVYPNFRGSNKTAQALGSDLVVADIVSAVDHVKGQTNIDADEIYCVGVSGGGHASLLMAARAPKLWAGVSAWCGISDIAAWHRQCKGTQFDDYAQQIEQALGGPPDASNQHLADAQYRSPLIWLGKADALPPLDINHGIDDGRTGSVPFTHSLQAWNASVGTESKLSSQSLQRFYETRRVPEELQATNNAAHDPLYGDNQPIYRRADGNIRVTVFDGGHEIVHTAALNWLAAQVKDKPTNWSPPIKFSFDAMATDQRSGK